MFEDGTILIALSQFPTFYSTPLSTLLQITIPDPLYTQKSKSGNNTMEIFKIKDTFLFLKVNKIKNIQKIINGSSKPKLYINMTTKDPFRKQVIALINSDNIKKFIDKSSSHISNLNRALKNIKLESYG